MSATLILTIYYRGLGSVTVDHIEREMEVSLNSEEFHSLNPFSHNYAEHSRKLHMINDKRKGELTFQ
jgi:hypothetical protein